MHDIYTLAAEKRLNISSFKMPTERLYYVKSCNNRLLLEGQSLTRIELEQYLKEYPSPGKGGDYAE